MNWQSRYVKKATRAVGNANSKNLQSNMGKGERLGTGISHTIPEDAKPDRYLRGEIDRDRIILIYSQSIEERDMKMNRILSGLKERGLYKKDSFPYRRGCIEPHEKLIGPWENWFDMNKDYI